MKLLRSRVGAVAVTLLGLTQGACSGSQQTGSISGPSRADTSERNRERGEAMPHQACIEGSSGVEALDVNGDGRPDLRTLMRDGRPYCRETDANFDGRVDIVRFFDPQGRTLRVEDDYDFDGRIDAVAFYVDGQLDHDVLDTNFDGRSDTWRDYRNGRIRELRRDTNADGRVDFWEHYNAEGRVERTEVDRDGDGQPDTAPGDGGAASAASGEGGAAPSDASATPAAPAASSGDASMGSNS